LAVSAFFNDHNLQLQQGLAVVRFCSPFNPDDSQLATSGMPFVIKAYHRTTANERPCRAADAE
jgi:hypothetical protein